MPKTLLVAEKPSVARDIARVMGVSGRGDGCLTSETMVVTWAIGHLVRLAEPDEISPEYKRWSMNTLPILPQEWTLEPISKTRSQLSIVKRLMKSREIGSIICATDAGREGELIFRWIYQLAGCTKPVQRLWISSMTDEAIREGMSTLKPDSAYDPLFQSALCRARADWLIGMNLSRAFTLKYDALLSIGRVQTPTLALLVRRKREIDDFTPQTNYTAEADFGAYRASYAQSGKFGDATSFEKRADAEQIVAAVRGQSGVVKRREASTVREAPPQLFDLTTLQREANRRFGFTAKKTLGVAQDLYEKHKLVTYPRTDCRFLPIDVKPKARKALETLPEPYAALAPAAVDGLDSAKLGRVFRKEIDSDHHALIPTGKRIDMARLKPDEQKLMDMIVRRLLAAFYPAYEARKLDLLTTVEADGRTYPFVATQKAHAVLGWKQVEGKLDELPPPATAQVGDTLPVKKASVAEHVTKPPQPYNDASILYAMEHAGKLVEDDELKDAMKKHGLGTPATRAAILERLIDVGYAQRKGKALLPTDKGVKLIDCVPPDLASAELTGKWEYGLNLIAEQKQVDQAFTSRFMDGVARMTSDLVHAVQTGEPAVQFEKERRTKGGRVRRTTNAIGVTCPLCQKGKVVENEKAFGCSRWRDGCSLTLWKDALARSGGPALNKVIVQRLIKDGQVRGSTGTIVLQGKQLWFQFANSTDVTRAIDIEGKKGKG